PKEARLRINPILQTWKPYKVRQVPNSGDEDGQNKKTIPVFLRDLMSTANKFSLRLECLALGRQNIRAMPMWYHALSTPRMRTLASLSMATLCIKERHGIVNVGEFEDLAALRSQNGHEEDSDTCECLGYDDLRTRLGCENPDACYARAIEFLDTLPERWDPRGEHPEDYEKGIVYPNPGRGWKAFERVVTTEGELGNTLRIFTHGGLANERLYMRVEQRRESPLQAATDGSCLHNGTRRAQAGAGVYMYDEVDHVSIKFRLPESLEQSNQAAEMLAIKEAVEAAPE
ncbi:hypothetical protein HDZ31DRAFT_25396, partial [Schizophyllum fasciatum]